MSVFTMPFPPTTNNLFRGAGKRRVKTGAYNAWLVEALESLRIQKPKPVLGPYKLVVLLHKPSRQRMDLSNRLKALEDCICKAGLIEDDSLAMCILMNWAEGEPKKGVPVQVALYPHGQGVRV